MGVPRLWGAVPGDMVTKSSKITSPVSGDPHIAEICAIPIVYALW